MADEEGRQAIFTERTDHEIWDGGLIKTGAAEIAEHDQGHASEVKVLTTMGMFAVPVTAETTVGEIRQKVQEWKPEYSLDQIELVCKDKDAWGPLFNKTFRPRDDDETVESLWSDWGMPQRMMQLALWIKEKSEEARETPSARARPLSFNIATLRPSDGSGVDIAWGPDALDAWWEEAHAWAVPPNSSQLAVSMFCNESDDASKCSSPSSSESPEVQFCSRSPSPALPNPEGFQPSLSHITSICVCWLCLWR